MAPLFTLWKSAYHSRFPQVILHTATSSSGTGIMSAATGRTDIGASDAYLSPADADQSTTHLANIPLAVAALMVICHVPGVNPSTHLRLDGIVLAQIFAGTITSWNDPAIEALNPGVSLPGTAILPVASFGQLGQHVPVHLLPERPGSRRLELLADRHQGRLARQPGELGASGSGASSAPSTPRPARSATSASATCRRSQDHESEVALGNSAGNFVLPAPDTVQAALASFTNTPANETISLINGSAAQAYPIINYEYAIVDTSQPSVTLAQDLRAFLTWAINLGTAQLAKVNFQPLPPSVITVSQAQIAEIRG